MQITYTCWVDGARSAILQISRNVQGGDRLARTLYRYLCDQFPGAAIKLDKIDLGVRSPGMRYRVLNETHLPATRIKSRLAPTGG